MATAETDTSRAENDSADQPAAEKDAFVRLMQAAKKETEKGEQLLLALVTAGDAFEAGTGAVDLGSLITDLLGDFCLLTGYSEPGAVPESLPVTRDPCADEHEDVANIVAQLEAENERVNALVTRALTAFAESEAPGNLGFPEIQPHIYADAVILQRISADAVRDADKFKGQLVQDKFDAQQTATAALQSALDAAREELASQVSAMAKAKTAHQIAYDAVQQELDNQRRVGEDLQADVNAVQEKLVTQQRLADERLQALEAAQWKFDRQQRMVEDLNAGLAQAQGDLESHRRVSEEALRDACNQLISRHQRKQEKLESEHLAVEKSWQERCDLLERRYEEWMQKSENDTRASEKLLHDFSSVSREFHELKGKIQELTAADKRVSTELQGVKDINVRLLDQLQKTRLGSDNGHLVLPARGQEVAGQFHEEKRSEASIEEIRRKENEILSLEKQLATAHRERQAAEDRLRQELEDKETQLVDLQGVASELADIAEREQAKAIRIGTEHAVCKEELSKAQEEHKTKASEVISLKKQLADVQGVADKLTVIAEQEQAKAVQNSTEHAICNEELSKAHQELKTQAAEVISLKKRMADIGDESMLMALEYQEKAAEHDRKCVTFYEKLSKAHIELKAKASEVVSLKKQLSDIQGVADKLTGIVEQERAKAVQSGTECAKCHEELSKAHKELRTTTSEVKSLKKQLTDVQGIADKLAGSAKQDQAKAAQIGIEYAKCHEELSKAHEELKIKASEVISLKEGNRKLQTRMEDSAKIIHESGKHISRIGIKHAKFHEDLLEVNKVLDAKVAEADTLKEENWKLQNLQDDYKRTIRELEEQIAQLRLRRHQRGAGHLFVAPGNSCPPVNEETMSGATTSSTTVESSPNRRSSRRDSFGTLVDYDGRLRETEERLEAAEAQNLELQRAMEAVRAARDEAERNAEGIKRSMEFFIEDSSEKERRIVELQQRCQSMKILHDLANKCHNDIQGSERGESVTDSPGNLGDTLPDGKPNDTIDQTVQAAVEKTAENFGVLQQAVADREKEIAKLITEKESFARTLKLCRRRLQEAQRDALRYRRKAAHHQNEMKQIEELIKASNQDYDRSQCPL